MSCYRILKKTEKQKRNARSQAPLRLFSPHGSIRLCVKFLTRVGSKKNIQNKNLYTHSHRNRYTNITRTGCTPVFFPSSTVMLEEITQASFLFVQLILLFLLIVYLVLSVYLAYQILVWTHSIFSCCKWDLVPRPGPLHCKPRVSSIGPPRMSIASF